MNTPSMIVAVLAGLMLASNAQAEKCEELSANGTQMRIVGGVVAPEAIGGWQVSLQYKGQHYCGGSLIATRGGRDWVLTAAHCVTSEKVLATPGPDLRVQHGSKAIGSGQTLAVRQIFLPSAWSGDTTKGNDIALFQLDGNFGGGERSSNSSSRPKAALPKQTRSLYQAERCAVVTGWGSTEQRDPKRSARSNAASQAGAPLMAVSLPLLDRAHCAATYREEFNTDIGYDQICAGVSEGGRDSCQGDSGGPLVVFDGITHVQIGVVSWGAGCASKNAYGLYTNTSLHTDWISKCVTGGCSPFTWPTN